MNKRFLLGWYTRIEAPSSPPFPGWITGFAPDDTSFETGRNSMTGVVDAPDLDAAWKQVAEYYPDWELRFEKEKPVNWMPGEDRFPVDEVKSDDSFVGE